MRLLACFSKSRVLDENARTNKDRPDKPAAEAPFVPTSIPELHPEYAHSEPYCFAARTDSARVVVEKMRGAQGQPTSQRDDILREEGVVIVRGPSHCAQKPNLTTHVPAPVAKPTSPVPLTIETPSTVDHAYAESDDTEPDENVNPENIIRSRTSNASQPPKSFDSKTAVSPHLPKKDRSKTKKSPAKPFRLISRKTKNSVTQTSAPIENILQPRNSNLTSSEEEFQDHSSYPTPPESEGMSESHEEEIQKHMDNTPKELLAPIRVPRMSGAFSENKPQPHQQPHPIVHSPAFSTESYGRTDSSQRYEDVEGDNSSGYVPMATVGKEKVIHKALHSPARSSGLKSRGLKPVLQEASSHSAISHTTKSRRKSKPFVPSVGSVDTFASIVDCPETCPPSEPQQQSRLLSNELGAVPEQAVLSRNMSLPEISDDFPPIDVPSANSYRDEMMTLSSTAANTATKHGVHDGVIDLPTATTQPQGIIRRSSSSKRKTVSFHTASPTIIEPNLRAPSSVPRSAILSRETEIAAQPVSSTSSALMRTRDSVKLKTNPMVKTTSSKRIEITSRQNSFQESISSDGEFQERSSRRMSTRVVVKDRNELKEASKRQSRAVAAAMSNQIRGVPKSAMLAFSENEVELSDTFEESDQDSSLSSLRRKSRASKSVRLPEIVAGTVPRPPPPPPFAPDMPRARSIRAPPPPPVSPLRY